MTTSTEFPKCASCNTEIKTFDQWFAADCPNRTNLQPEDGGHQLTTEEWMSLPFEQVPQLPHPAGKLRSNLQ